MYLQYLMVKCYIVPPDSATRNHIVFIFAPVALHASGSNSNVRRRDPDSVFSAQALLSERSEYTSTYFAANLRAIAFYIPT
jgi:hypothetical protein